MVKERVGFTSTQISKHTFENMMTVGLKLPLVTEEERQEPV